MTRVAECLNEFCTNSVVVAAPTAGANAAASSGWTRPTVLASTYAMLLAILCAGD